MKRCWLGVALLALFLVLGLISSSFLGRFGEDLSREAERAAALADTDREKAEEILKNIHRHWEQKRFLLMVLTDHEPIREADAFFALLASPSEPDSFRENALRLSALLSELAGSQLPALENIL